MQMLVLAISPKCVLMKVKLISHGDMRQFTDVFDSESWFGEAHLSEIRIKSLINSITHS